MIRKILLLFCLVFFIFPVNVFADWPQEARDAQHTGYSSDSLPTPWTFKWQWNGSCSPPDGTLGSDCRPGDPNKGYSFQLPLKTHPVIGNGKLFIPAGANGIYAVRESDGKTDWRNTSINSRVSAAYDSQTNAVFVSGSDGKLYKLNSANGSVISSFQANSGLNLAPIIVDNGIFIISENGTLYKVDKNTMQQIWKYEANSRGQTPAAYSQTQDVLVYATEDLYVHCVNNSSGTQRWRVKPSPNTNSGSTYDGGQGVRYLTYNWEHGWPVVAEDHGIVFVRLHIPWSAAIWTIPGGSNWYPTSNSAIRSFLESNPSVQTLFALRLTDGTKAFTPAVGPGGMDTPDLNSGMTLGPLPVIRVVGGKEVTYMLWRNGQKCEAGDCTDPRWDAVMGEMVLDSTTVTGYQAGDLRFVNFKSSLDFLISDEMGMLTMAGDWLFHSHWLAAYIYRITDRSNSFGGTYSNPIKTEKGNHIMNRASGVSSPSTSHFSSGTFGTYMDSRSFSNAFWVFLNANDPPYTGTINGWYTTRYTVFNNNTIYYVLNGGSIFAVQSSGSSSTPTPYLTNPPVPSPTRTPTPIPTGSYLISDINRDGTVNRDDVLTVLISWLTSGSSTYSNREDINKNGKVNGIDFGLVMRDWGR